MTTPPPIRWRSAFVPHDLAHPIAGRPDGPLSGFTVAVKDMFDLAGERTGGGNPDWLAARSPATTHAAVAQRLLDAGATIIGKTVCDEFFYSVAGMNAHYGTPVNPRTPDRLPGGSSSGSASATAAGAADIGLGSDTGGSIRIPAAQCGLYGIRTTHGRVDAHGAMAMAPSFDAIGWMTTGPGLLRRVGGALLGGTPRRARVARVLLAEDALAEADARVATLVTEAAQCIPALAAPRVSGLMRVCRQGALEDWREIFRIVQAREVWETFGSVVTAHQPKLGPGIRERMEAAAQVTPTEADAARARRDAIRVDLTALLAPGTVLVIPTAPATAPRLDAPLAEIESYRTRIMRLTAIAGLGGLPQVTLPLGTLDGAPIGLSLVGWAGGDEDLLDLAVAAAPWCGVAA